MRILTFTAFINLLISCKNEPRKEVTKTNNTTVESKSKFSLEYLNYYKPFKTPLGRTISYRMLNDSFYFLEWEDSSYKRTLPDTFYLDGRIPIFRTENKNYVVLEQGCGSPCWVGIFLPTNNSGKPHLIHEYLDYDLKNNLVVYVDDTNSIKILNLKTDEFEIHKTPPCKSAFIGYCIDSISIRNKVLIYWWIPETYINSKNGIKKRELIKI